MNELFAMLIWVGGLHGGPATITGFNTMEACRWSIPAVSEFYKKHSGQTGYIECVTLQKR